MLNDSLAPIKRAFFFFGFMGVTVATLTFGAGLQDANDQSSATVAQAKIARQEPTDVRFAAVDPTGKVVGAATRALARSQEARLEAPIRSVMR